MCIRDSPYPYSIDNALAERGRPIFENSCARCHVPLDGVPRDTVIPIREVMTDPGRLDSYTVDLSANQSLTFSGVSYRGEDKRFRHYRKTGGYVSPPLDGIWLRAPYLHNGSVPTLRDLLRNPEDRPRHFYRGDDVFDQQSVGFVSTVAEENGNAFFPFDTSLPGNGNGGHRYGNDLPEDQKAALLEYLKTM